jgi:AbrB family looped-hinge helix DNA binding protein
MATTMRSTIDPRGRVTIPKPIRDALELSPGARLEFAVSKQGEVVLRPSQTAASDRFEAVRGSATVRWRTDELMALLRD